MCVYEYPGKVMVKGVQWILKVMNWKADLKPEKLILTQIEEWLKCHVREFEFYPSEMGTLWRFFWSEKSCYICDVHSLWGSEV